jgi:hypothetical protein
VSRARALRDALNEWLAAQGRAPLAPPAAGAPPLLAKGPVGAALEGPVGVALALSVALAASMGGGMVAALSGSAPLASLLLLLFGYFALDARGRGGGVGAALARRRR